MRVRCYSKSDEMTINQLKEHFDEFLDRWTIDNVQKLNLKEYVGLGNKDSFCQWVETKTRMLGSKKGMTSIKFGIYEQKDKTNRPKNYKNDGPAWKSCVTSQTHVKERFNNLNI